MNLPRLKSALAITTLFLLPSIVCVLQQLELRRVREHQRKLSTELQELSGKYAALLAVAEARNAEDARLQQGTAELLRLRNEVTQLRKQLAAKSDNCETQESFTDRARYLRRDQVNFVGFDSPENAVQSWGWALMNNDYTNWVATLSLSPERQQELLADPDRGPSFLGGSDLQGMQVLSAKPVSSDRTELKVRFDTENSVKILILPMVAVGNEWKLGDEIQPYTAAWDRPANAQ